MLLTRVLISREKGTPCSWTCHWSQIIFQNSNDWGWGTVGWIVQAKAHPKFWFGAWARLQMALAITINCPMYLIFLAYKNQKLEKLQSV